ncbi:prolactin receptor [Dissostichus eleginoides]|uniref:Prolactin receptor n=1 Tax=Dissostichus eleginoides TaxID=100907 RepID=A0AAD9B330_DISEL|nr:prolactin receptor [Dissostichus eleginoides]
MLWLLLLLLPRSATAGSRLKKSLIRTQTAPKRFELLTVNTAGLCVPHIPSWTNPPRQEVPPPLDVWRGGGSFTLDVKSRPHIYFCRSPNMEDFSCWWRPLENLTEEVSYVLTYSKDKEPQQECPDYVSSGPNSCHFDKKHTIIWKFYCLNVTAVTKHGNYTSQKHCLDVADIVQMEAPVNLSFVLEEAGGDEMGHNALLSWIYPVPAHLKYGWITLEHELQYRRVSEPDVWKVKYPLREPQVELLGLPVGEFVVRVRCRSHNARLWSEWSDPLMMSIPARPPAGKLLVLILVTGVGVVALLVVTLGLLPQSRRIKNYFLPPIPKPRIIGIDPLLLKVTHTHTDTHTLTHARMHAHTHTHTH